MVSWLPGRNNTDKVRGMLISLRLESRELGEDRHKSIALLMPPASDPSLLTSPPSNSIFSYELMVSVVPS